MKTPQSAVMFTPLGDAPLRKFLVEDKPHRKCGLTVPARDAAHARRLAADLIGLTGPTFVTEVP